MIMMRYDMMMSVISMPIGMVPIFVQSRVSESEM